MSCPNCENTTNDCGCSQESLHISQICNPIDCSTEECTESFPAKCSIYTGDPITCNAVTIVQSGDSMAQAVANIVALICNQDTVASDIDCGVDTVVPAGTTVNAALALAVAYFCARLVTIEADITELQELPGLAAEIATSTAIVNTLTETTLLGTLVGAVTVPANDFVIGDTFLTKMRGNLNVGATPVNLTIRIKINGSAVITKVVSMKAATAKNWDMEILFTIRTLGATANLAIGGHFSYAEDASDKHTVEDILTVIGTLDTTVINTLDISAEWSVADPTNSIDTEIFVLHKVY